MARTVNVITEELRNMSGLLGTTRQELASLQQDLTLTGATAARAKLAGDTTKADNAARAAAQLETRVQEKQAEVDRHEQRVKALKAELDEAREEEAPEPESHEEAREPESDG